VQVGGAHATAAGGALSRGALTQNMICLGMIKNEGCAQVYVFCCYYTTKGLPVGWTKGDEKASHPNGHEGRGKTRVG